MQHGFGRITQNTPTHQYSNPTRHERTLGFKDSYVNSLVTSDQDNIRRETEDGVSF